MTDGKSEARAYIGVWALVDPGVLYGMPKYGEHVELEPIGSEGRVPSGVNGQCPWWGSGGLASLELMAFCENNN